MLSMQQRMDLELIRKAILYSFQKLAIMSAAKSWALFAFRPKFHHLDEIIRFSIDTGISPYVGLTLNNESLAGDYVKLARGTHPRTMSQRTLQRWLATYLVEFR